MTADIPIRPIGSASWLEPLARYTLASLALFAALIGYCELCSLVSGSPAVGLHVSAPWAVQVALPWIFIGAAFGTFGQRLADCRAARAAPRAFIGLVVFCIAAFALSVETTIAALRDSEASLSRFTYLRAPTHLAVSALLVALYLGNRFLRAPAPAASTATSEATLAASTLEVMTGTGRTCILIEEIECLQADGNYINVIHSSGRIYLLRRTLAAAEQELGGDSFLRIHRSTIVNRSMIKERRPGGLLVLRSGRTVSVGRAYRARLH